MLTKTRRDIIDYEKFTISGDVNKMLLGSFVEEMDAINNEDGGNYSPGDSPLPHATGSIMSNSVALNSIEEELHDRLPESMSHMRTRSHSMQRRENGS